MTKKEFFSKYKDDAIKIQKETGVPASLILAQAALESGYGNSAPGNNFFGVKGSGNAGSQRLMTTEVVNGREVRVQQNFRAYKTPADSFRDHARLISESPYYKGVMKAAKTGDAYAVAKAIGDSPYATDPNYGNKIKNIIKEEGLDKISDSGEVLGVQQQAKPQTQQNRNIIQELSRSPEQASSAQLRPATQNTVQAPKINRQVQSFAVPKSPAVQPRQVGAASATRGQTYVRPVQRTQQAFSSASTMQSQPLYKAPTPSSYTVKRGDTPSQIAQAQLGDASRWRELWQGDPRKMPVGAVLKIPTPSSVRR